MASRKVSIGSSNVEIEWFENVMKNKFSVVAKLRDVDEIGKGKGFNSQLFRIFLRWEGEGENLPESVIVKVCAITAKEGEMSHEEIKIMKSHNCECDIYEMFEKEAPVPVPKCLYSRKVNHGTDGILILEDIVQGVVKPVTMGLNREQLMEFAKMLARLHSYSLSHDEWKSNRSLQNNDSKIGKVDNYYLDTLKQAGRKLKSAWGAHFDPLVDKLVTVYDSFDPGQLTRPRKALNLKYGLPKVLVQGDMWIHNMIFNKIPDSGQAGDELLYVIDWQLSHHGCPMEDITDCLTTSVTSEIRRKHTVEVLQQYYESLKAELGEEPPFTLDNVKKAYKECFKLQVLMLIPAFASFPKQAELLGKDQDAQMPELLQRAKALIEDALIY